MHFNPRDQIVLLAGLDPNVARRAALYARPELQKSVARLTAAGYLTNGALSDPSGLAAARRLHHIGLDDLIAEHLDADPAPPASLH